MDIIKEFFTNITVYQIVIAVVGGIILAYVGYKTYKCNDDNHEDVESYNRIFKPNHNSYCKLCGSKIGIDENITILSNGVLCSHCGRHTEKPLKVMDEEIKKRVDQIKEGKW